jgi:long-chain acyl-CoA synthetase
MFSFYRSLGINVKQLYGMTESSVFICIQPDGEVRPDTVGTPVQDVDVRIDETGEVLFRGPGVFQGYYKNDAATRAAKRPDGWVHTGDAGIFDAHGHLTIIDRAKDVGHLRGGALFAPKFIENKLKFFPFVKEAVAFGDGRDFVTAFINIDLEAVGNWAERRGIAYGSFQELSADEGVHALVGECIEKVNQDLAAESALAGSQIHRFLILPKELDADDGELTRTRKVRRRFIGERYATLVAALNDGRDSAHIETAVTFEDGRKGVLKADLKIRAAKTVPLAGPAPILRKAS